MYISAFSPQPYSLNSDYFCFHNENKSHFMEFFSKHENTEDSWWIILLFISISPKHLIHWWESVICGVLTPHLVYLQPLERVSSVSPEEEEPNLQRSTFLRRSPSWFCISFYETRRCVFIKRSAESLLPPVLDGRGLHQVIPPAECVGLESGRGIKNTDEPSTAWWRPPAPHTDTHLDFL